MGNIDERILSVVVLYHCKLADSRTYRTLQPRNEDLIVYDNSETGQDVNSIVTGVKYVFNGDNIGLSACYNKAARYARGHGYKWLLLLDQDTDFSEVTIEDYEDTISTSQCKLIAPMVKCGEFTMSPVNIRGHFARLSRKHYSGVVDIRNLSVINSGLCVALDAFEACGGYNEKVFLDYSDHEFIRRFKRVYHTAIILPKTIHQNFSVKSDGKVKSLNRFRLFCLSIRGCEIETALDKVLFSFVVLKRACSLTLKFKTWKPLSIVLENYYLRSNV